LREAALELVFLPSQLCHVRPELPRLLALPLQLGTQRRELLLQLLVLPEELELIGGRAPVRVVL
jgi:hypothetical protein